MGFGKDNEEHPKKEKHRTDGFEPSSADDIKQYSKRARKAERLHKKEKHREKEERGNKDKQPRLSGDALRTALVERTQFKVYRRNFFDAFIESCKAFDIKKPRYHEYLEQKKADARFCFEISGALSRMPWLRLSQLIHAGVSAKDRPIGLTTQSWSEAFHFTEHVMHLALGAVEKKGTLRLTDLSVLDEWPVESRKCPIKEDKMKNDVEGRNAAMKAKADDNEDKDDDNEEEEEGKGGEDEDEDEENEKPKSKKKGFSKKGKRAGRQTSDDADEDDDSEDEDEDEKPKRKGRKVSKENDDDTEESDESDDDDDEDEKPAKKKRRSKSSAGEVRPSKRGKKEVSDDDEDESPKGKKEKDVSKKSKKDKSKKKDKPEKKERPAKVKFEDKVTVSKIGDREKGGPKTKLLGLIPKKGITVKALTETAKEEGIKSSKVKNFLKSLHKYGYIKAE